MARRLAWVGLGLALLVGAGALATWLSVRGHRAAVAPDPPPVQAPEPDPELPARRALFEASWDVVHYARPVTEVYAALEQGHVWVGPEGLTAPGRDLLDLLAGLEAHGLDPRAVRRDRLVAEARAWRPVDGVEARADLELRLAVAWAYALDHLGGLLDRTEERLVEWAQNRWRERTERYVASVARVRQEGLGPQVAALLPDDDDYRALQAALARYREMAAAEGFPPAPSVNRRRRRWLERGKTGPQVQALVRRLAAEGFYELPPPEPPREPEVPEVFDASVEQAVRAYQAAHGLEPDGVVGPAVLKWLRRSPEEMVLWLRAALRRAREAPSRAGGAFVRVNIPEYRLEVVEDGAVRLTFRVVVGDETEKEDEDTGKKSRPNATPEATATITHLVWNPQWQVPDRIKREELDFNLLEDPNWYAANGYGLEVDDAGNERAVQLPGPENALGRVKVLFPNPWNVYLHDTPKRGLFQRPRRAYSHGCMRMEKPMELAQLLLERGGQWDAEEVKHLMEDAEFDEDHPKGLYERRWVKLKAPMPIHIEYRTARAADPAEIPGGVRFFEDIYERDTPYRERLAAEDARLAREVAREAAHATPHGAVTRGDPRAD